MFSDHSLESLSGGIYKCFKCILAASLLGNVVVTKERNAEKNVVHDVYLLHLLRRTRGTQGLDAEQTS